MKRLFKEGRRLARQSWAIPWDAKEPGFQASVSLFMAIVGGTPTLLDGRSITP